ncbi:hypothetical protein CFP56_032465, partial [Quercus suber]
VALNWTRYVLAIAILSTVYTGGQVMRQAYELCTGKLLLQQRSSTLLDFWRSGWSRFFMNFDDTRIKGALTSNVITHLHVTIMAYLLISAASSALPLTICLRTLAYQKFTNRQFSRLFSISHQHGLSGILSVGIVCHNFSIQITNSILAINVRALGKD